MIAGTTLPRESVDYLTTFSLHYAHGAAECDHCGATVRDRADLWHFGGRAEVCAACRDEVIAGPFGAVALERLSTCERLPADAGEHGPVPTFVLDINALARGWAA